METIETFLKTSFQNVRSSKRTDRFHEVLLNEILNLKPEWAEYDWIYGKHDANGKLTQKEYVLKNDGFRGSFKIDIAGFKNGELKVAILGKALNSSINKNLKSYADITVGESKRIMRASGVELEKVLFVSVLPRVAPRLTKAGKVSGFDDVVKAKSRTQINHILEEDYGDKVQAIDLFYDIEGVRTLQDFSTISVTNLDTLTLV